MYTYVMFRGPDSKKQKHKSSQTRHFSNNIEMVRRKVTSVSLKSLKAVPPFSSLPAGALR